MPRIVTIQFSHAGKLYDFLVGDLEIKSRDRVVVETERGMGIATVVCGPCDKDEADLPPNMLKVRRVATAEDLDTLEQNAVKEREAFEFCSRRIAERAMQMKLVQVEYMFDSSKAIFYFTADGRVDFRDLVKDLAHTFHTRIEMRQIGVRDESKMVGGLGICGRDLCCCSWLREFQPVSVKMAKEQNLALNPSKISGQCGRLLCCLDYEYETYCSLRKTFPKCGKRVRTATATGVVDKLNILTGQLSLRLDDGKVIMVRKGDVLGEAAPGDQQQPRPEAQQQPQPQGQRPSQKQRDRRPERHRRPEEPRKQVEELVAEQAEKPAQPAAAPEAEAAAAPKKKKRFRRHGHRKPGGGGGNPAAPAA